MTLFTKFFFSTDESKNSFERDLIIESWWPFGGDSVVTRGLGDIKLPKCFNCLSVTNHGFPSVTLTSESSSPSEYVCIQGCNGDRSDHQVFIYKGRHPQTDQPTKN